MLQPYFRNLGKRLVKTPKIYFMDTGLLCFLAGIQSVTALQQSALLGAIFETLTRGNTSARATIVAGCDDLFLS